MSTSNTVSFKTGVQYGFYFNQARCMGCQACVLACTNWNQLSPGPGSKWIKLMQHEEGAFPDVRECILFVPCYQCANPVCVTAANGAMYKEPKYGAVLIDPEKASSSAMRDAWNACPYGAIVFDSDSPTANASKCTMCIDRLEQGLMPVCVMACPMRALDFGPITDLQKTYGTNSEISTLAPNQTGLPPSNTTTPSVVFKVMDPRKQIVPYVSGDALTLMASRVNSSTPAPYYPQNLPPLFTKTSDVTDLSTVKIGRNKVVLKPQSTEELMYYCTDEG